MANLSFLNRKKREYYIKQAENILSKMQSTCETNDKNVNQSIKVKPTIEEKYYSAKEIGDKLDISYQKVGLVAKKYKISQNPEYIKSVTDFNGIRGKRIVFNSKGAMALIWALTQKEGV